MNNKFKCKICNTTLEGRKTSFCSRKCRNKDINRRHKNYECQQTRGWERKAQLVTMLGGQCKCGYDENLAALSFHHLDPKTKKFGLDIRQCSNRSWNVLVKEANKCKLMCVRCHMELHFPEGANWKKIGSAGFEPAISSIMSRVL